ncbi:MAG: ABC transporter permease [Proteobacteria bacterium SG_bin7]|nr:MAG: ABC transporter permease [Proteobacteria bacterium SG_bin7]
MTESIKLCFHITHRNWMVYKKDFIANISPTLADPAFYILSLGLGLGTYVANISGHSYVEFMAPGMTVTTALFTSFFETSYGFYVRMTYENIYKAMLTTPIGVREIVMGEFIWVSLKGAVMALGVSLVLALFGLMKAPFLILLMPAVGLLLALPCGAMGLMASAMVRNINQFQTVYSFMIAPLFFFSGVFFPMEQSPHWVQYICYAFPIAHAVRLAQAVFWSQEIVRTFCIHGSILLLQSFILCWVAYKKVIKKLTF